MIRNGPLIAFLAVLVGATSAGAQYVKWTDEQGNTHYTDSLPGIPDHFRATAVPLGLRNSPPPPPGSERSNAMPAASGGATIRYSPGERIMVDAKINGNTPVRLLLDTGADRTLISPQTLWMAGVSSRTAVTGPILGVTGQAEAASAALESLEVQEARVTGMHIIAFDMKRPGVDGLLGRDFLEQFNVNIDSRAGTVTIRPK
jgi:Aspartyl protease/Domain of unknown function (DUF4124)